MIIVLNITKKWNFYWIGFFVLGLTILTVQETSGNGLPCIVPENSEEIKKEYTTLSNSKISDWELTNVYVGCFGIIQSFYQLPEFSSETTSYNVMLSSDYDLRYETPDVKDFLKNRNKVVSNAISKLHSNEVFEEIDNKFANKMISFSYSTVIFSVTAYNQSDNKSTFEINTARGDLVDFEVTNDVEVKLLPMIQTARQHAEQFLTNAESACKIKYCSDSTCGKTDIYTSYTIDNRGIIPYAYTARIDIEGESCPPFIKVGLKPDLELSYVIPIDEKWVKTELPSIAEDKLIPEIHQDADYDETNSEEPDGIRINSKYGIQVPPGETKEITLNCNPDEYAITAFIKVTSGDLKLMKSQLVVHDPEKIRGESWRGKTTLEAGAVNNGDKTGTFYAIVHCKNISSESIDKQISLGISEDKIQCKENFELIFKSTDGSPACVKPKTAEKLIERGWARPIVQNVIPVTESEKIDTKTAMIDDENVLLISGIVYENNTTILDPWYRIKNKADTQLNNDGDILVFYLDENENVIAKTGFGLATKISHGYDFSGNGGFSVRIPDVEGTKKIILKRDGEILTERIVSSNPPEVTIISPNGGEVFIHGDSIHVTWQSSDVDGDELFYQLSYSRDGGSIWIPLTIDIPNTEYIFTAQPNVNSDLILIRVTATDGINTDVDTTDSTFTIRPPN